MYSIIVANIFSTTRILLIPQYLARSEHNVGETNYYRHLHHYVSRYITTWVFIKYGILGLFLSWVPIPQIISVLFPTIVFDALHILKEYQMPDHYPIHYFFFTGEDKNGLSLICLHFHSWN